MSETLVFITDDEARQHLRLGPSGQDTNDDADLTNKIQEASGIFTEFLKNLVPEDWYTADSPPVFEPPPEAKSVVLNILANLWDKRGYDPTPEAYPLMRLMRGHVIG